ncbi:MAG: hypothetical protein HETSPECPRED_003005 [Heterodermia speciosa]|uniref:Uncharacterized protein n=1 Tax=Heterodermia speciosa TaxID=116794 RepID=A0A8H3F498_9LECA|nr:MAG: hypothetical protein HETSPECPRED_003005 [Heterodermia speciosa]
MTRTQSPNESHAQSRNDTHGCGAQFSKPDTKYPQSQDLDGYLLEKNQQQQTSKQQTSKQQSLPRREGSDTSNSKIAGRSQDPMAKWQAAPRREMPWDGVGAVRLGASGKEGGSSKRVVQSRESTSVGAVAGSLEKGRSL